jgi:hypothetical protein
MKKEAPARTEKMCAKKKWGFAGDTSMSHLIRIYEKFTQKFFKNKKKERAYLFYVDSE